jgi:dehydrogenase/reductase SDR family protein 12
MKLLKIIFLQIFWYLAVSKGSDIQVIVFLTAIAFSFLNFHFYRPAVTLGHYLFTLSCFIIYGLTQELLLEELRLVNYNQDSIPLWLLSLYVVFIGYYGDIFNYLSKKSNLILFLMGSTGGVFAYYSGSKISSIEILSPYYLILIGISWGVFFILSFKIFYEGFMWNKLLDASIYYSFDKSGFIRHSRDFKALKGFRKGSHALITGGSSGIGQAVSIELAKQEVNVTITGRNKEKGEAASNDSEFINFVNWDMANWDEIESLVDSIQPLEYIVLNAGGMPKDFDQNSFGVELQFASQLFGHYYLIKALKEKGKLLKEAKIIWVTSGGMYLSKLDLSKIKENDEYDKVATYANVKRAQVTLLPFLKSEFPNQTVTCMHPGWVATPGVSSAIPEFDKKMSGKLRTPIQGADTILWLLSENSKNISSGDLYFDRKKVKKHLFWFTKKSDQKLPELIESLNKTFIQ